MAHFYLHFVAVIIYCNVDWLESTSRYSGLEFGRLETFYYSADSVIHIESDQLRPGHLLFSDGCSLKSTNGKITTLIAGLSSECGSVQGNSQVARFGGFGGFIQVASGILVSDYVNHCLEFVDRTSYVVSVFAGKCKSNGFADGIGLDASFYTPRRMILDPRNMSKLILADYSNKAIRSVDYVTKEVATLFRDLTGSPYALALSADQSNMYVTFENFIAKITLETGEFKRLVGSLDAGSADGLLPFVRFNYPKEIVRLVDDSLLVADRDNHRLRFIKQNEGSVVSFCTGQQKTIDGEMDTCSLDAPYSFARIGDDLYIGQNKAIRRIAVSKITSNSSDCPDRPIILEIQANETEAVFEFVAGETFYYPPGNYRLEYTDKNCSIMITVKRASNASSSCPNSLSLRSDPHSKSANHSFMVGTAHHNVNFPYGIHSYSASFDGEQCSMDIKVYDFVLRRRLEFLAKYAIKCNKLDNPGTLNLIKLVTKSKFPLIEEICSGECRRLPTEETHFTCSSDVVSVYWPTDIDYPANYTYEYIPKELRSAVRKELSVRQNIFELILPTNIPPIVYPITNKDSPPVTLTLTPFCSEGSSYSEKTDTCI